MSSGHTNVPFHCAFLKNGIYGATCDGSIHLWDTEKKRLLIGLGGAKLSTTTSSSFAATSSSASTLGIYDGSSGSGSSGISGGGTLSSALRATVPFSSMSIIATSAGPPPSSLSSLLSPYLP
jgi:hypothetical protein